MCTSLGNGMKCLALVFLLALFFIFGLNAIHHHLVLTIPSFVECSLSSCRHGKYVISLLFVVPLLFTYIAHVYILACQRCQINEQAGSPHCFVIYLFFRFPEFGSAIRAAELCMHAHP
ncbi:hypothetical protein ACOSP7_025010 [Xanthoceras sorbifolium]